MSIPRYINGSVSYSSFCILVKRPKPRIPFTSLNQKMMSSQPIIPCILNNQPFITNQTYPVYRVDSSSSPRQVLHEVSCCSVEDAIKIVESAQSAFPAWKATPPSKRREIFLKAHQLLQQRIPQLISQTVQETCVTKGMAAYELAVLASGHLVETASTVSQALKTELLAEDGIRKYIYREPYGVVVGISPWNAPFLLGLRSVLYAIAAGNTAILKSSEFAPRVHNEVAQLLIDAGLPSGVLSVIHVDPKDVANVTEAMISHRAVRKLNFTGSIRVGKVIAQTAAKYIKPVVLELGGKASVIVLPDADLDLVSNHILFGGFLNSNQICMSINNILVPSSLEKPLQEKLNALFQKNKEKFIAKSSQSLEDQHVVRCLYTPASGERVKSLYQDAISNGAKVIVGQPGFEGSLVQPIILADVKDDMKIYTEEVFGPILSMISYDETDTDQAVRIVNQSEMGLSSSVFSRNLESAFQIAKQIESGQVHINSQPVHDDPAMPHGGWKQSGYGRFNGLQGIQEFTQFKGITVQNGSLLPFELL